MGVERRRKWEVGFYRVRGRGGLAGFATGKIIWCGYPANERRPRRKYRTPVLGILATWPPPIGVRTQKCIRTPYLIISPNGDN